MDLPLHLKSALDDLLRRSEDAGRVTLDEIGDAIGSGAVDTNQIDFILGELESRGRRIVAPSGQNGVSALMKILPAARKLGTELGRTARVAEIAERTGLGEDEVRRALLLARVMAR